MQYMATIMLLLLWLSLRLLKKIQFLILENTSETIEQLWDLFSSPELEARHLVVELFTV